MDKSKDLPPIEDLLLDMPDDISDLQEVSAIVFTSAFGDDIPPFERMRAREMLPHITYKLHLFQGICDEEAMRFNRQYEMKFPAYAQMFQMRHECCMKYYQRMRVVKNRRRHRRAVKSGQDAAQTHIPDVAPSIDPLSDRSFFTDNSELVFHSVVDSVDPPLIVYRPSVPLECEATNYVSGSVSEDSLPINTNGEPRHKSVPDLTHSEFKSSEINRELSVSATRTRVDVVTSTHTIVLESDAVVNGQYCSKTKMKTLSDNLSKAISDVRACNEPSEFDISGVTISVKRRKGPKSTAVRIHLNRRPERLVPFVNKYKDTVHHWNSLLLLLREAIGIRCNIPSLSSLAYCESLRVQASSIDPGG